MPIYNVIILRLRVLWQSREIYRCFLALNRRQNVQPESWLKKEVNVLMDRVTVFGTLTFLLLLLTPVAVLSVVILLLQLSLTVLMLLLKKLKRGAVYLKMNISKLSSRISVMTPTMSGKVLLRVTALYNTWISWMIGQKTSLKQRWKSTKDG